MKDCPVDAAIVGIVIRSAIREARLGRMQLARDRGGRRHCQDANLTGSTLLVLQPIDAAGEDVGRTLVALDSVGAGVGECVFFVRGREAAFPFYPAEPPADAAIVGIVDHWDVEGTEAAEKC